MKAALFMLMTLAAIWAYCKTKINRPILLVIIGIIACVDLFSVNNRYLNADNYQSERRQKAHYNPRKVDTQILKDKDLSYRVLDYSINTFNSSFASYFHKTIGGYHAAKLQRYQDLIEYHIAKNNMNVLNMLNAKYFITGQAGSEQARLNSAALGNCWFVNEVQLVPTADAEIEALTDFDPLGTAFIHKEFESDLSSTSFEKSGTIKLDSYAPNKLVYSSNSTSNQLALFSEIWYGPNKGWKAYIDDQPVEHLRANYVLRALEIPQGQHRIVFEFDPDSNSTGRIISLLCNILFVLTAGYYFWTLYKEKKSLV